MGAIASVWQSCYSQRVLSYDGGEEQLMGIVIQPMVDAKLSGVCFSHHPSPRHVFERGSMVIEYSDGIGEELVSGSVTPSRLVGRREALLSEAKEGWVEALIEIETQLHRGLGNGVDMEFAVDHYDRLWLLQQRPISAIAVNETLDLRGYDRRYKRKMAPLDIELLIQGCSKHLPTYLGFNFAIDPWMVMTTGSDGAGELWIERQYEREIIAYLKGEMERNRRYLAHLLAQYSQVHTSILARDYSAYEDNRPLHERFESWWEMMEPLAAHYYAPMLIIEALQELLLEGMSSIDPKDAKGDLFELAAFGIQSLYDVFESDLRQYEKLSETQLEKLSKEYGFLKCHQPEEMGYSPREILEIHQNLGLPAQASDRKHFDQLMKKYAHSDLFQRYLAPFREWMSIRNQEMEYYMYASNASRGLFDEMGKVFEMSVEAIWSLCKKEILSGLKWGRDRPQSGFTTAV